MSKQQLAIGIDLGGTNARAGLIDSNGQVIKTTQISTKLIQRPTEFVNWTVEALDILTNSSSRISGVGIGFPGSVDASAGIVHGLTNLPGWKNLAVVRLLEKKLKTTVRIDNDANAMAQAEFYMGAAKGVKNAVFLTLGTGIGGGLLINGELFHGSTFSAAEIGHMRAGFGSTLCACGKKGCIETEMGNGYLLKKFRSDLRTGKVKSKVIKKILEETADDSRGLESLTKAAALGDSYALRFWTEAGEKLGDFLSGICNLLNPQVIVLGGGVMGAGRYLLNPIRTTIKQQAFAKASFAVKVVRAKFGNKAGLIGAAALIMRKP